MRPGKLPKYDKVVGYDHHPIDDLDIEDEHQSQALRATESNKKSQKSKSQNVMRRKRRHADYTQSTDLRPVLNTVLLYPQTNVKPGLCCIHSHYYN